MASRTPPKFVPTLTEVVQAGPAQASPAAAPPPVPEQLAQRVLQRVDLVLERRLRETIGTVILEQTQALAPVLRGRLEVLVRQVVADALAEELHDRQRGQG